MIAMTTRYAHLAPTQKQHELETLMSPGLVSVPKWLQDAYWPKWHREPEN